MSKRGTFEAFKKEAIILCENESYLVSRNRKKKHPTDGPTSEITQKRYRKNIRIIFIEITYNIVQSLENKIIAYIKISAKVNCFKNLENQTDSTIKMQIMTSKKLTPKI